MRVCFIIEDVTHGGGEPVGAEDDDVAQGGVVFVMREMTEAVRDGDEEPRDLIVHVVGAADGEDFIAKADRARPCLAGLARTSAKLFGTERPTSGRLAATRAMARLSSSMPLRLPVLIGFAFHEEKVNDGVLAEEVPQFLTVNIGLALLRSAVRGDDEDLGARLAALDELNPFLDEALLRTFARLPDDEIDGGRAEEQLVRGTVDALSAEVPAVEGDFCFAFRGR